MAVERSETFIVNATRFRGNHFTCVGAFDGGFYAGDTNGRMWKSVELTGVRYSVEEDVGRGWERREVINAESINVK